jgi:hypothetical protein
LENIMKRIILTLALLTSIASPALAFPTGVEVPTMTWPDQTVTSQSCIDPVALAPATCATR